MSSTTSFREFLAEKAREDGSVAERKNRRNEWVAAVNRLLDQFRRWLKEADANDLLEVYPLDFDKLEKGLGPYHVSGLKIGLGDAAVEVVPVGRNTMGFVGPDGNMIRAAGRIDVRGGARKYQLYRTLNHDMESWRVVDDDHHKGATLDQTTFENMLLDLLS
jgi:hypothetical protein